MQKKILFNFSSSYTGGGLKRLLAFSEWFDNCGGAVFIVHVKSKRHLSPYKNNTYFYINSSKFRKALNDHKYLIDVINCIGVPCMYYSYGIPIPYKVGLVNWFHLSNVLPLVDHSGYGLSLKRSIELKWLGKLIKKNYKNAEVLSAESSYSLSLFPSNVHSDLVVSPNGSDKEIVFFKQSKGCKVNNIAVIVGTFFYKDLKSSYNIFLDLRLKNSKLKLIIIGDKTMIPHSIKNDQNVDAIGEVSHDKVIALLSSAKFYINTSKVENSWNAASEGVILAQKSFLSDINPHLELLDIIAYKKYMHDDIINVEKKNLTPKDLPAWKGIIADIIGFIN